MTGPHEEAVDRLIRTFGAILLSEDWPDRGYPDREAVEYEAVEVAEEYGDLGAEREGVVDDDWSRWGSLLRAG